MRTFSATLALALVAAQPCVAFDGAAEAENYAKQRERQLHESATPGYASAYATEAPQATFDSVAVVTPDRLPITACAGQPLCTGDPRLAAWTREHALVRRVSWLNPNGAAVDGHLWVARAVAERGDAVPGVILSVGDFQEPETALQWAAVTLAKHGYLVLTWDPQGHGESETFGEGEHATRHVVEQQLGDLAPDPSAVTADAVEQLQSALDYFTSEANPLRPLLDLDEIGLAGHSRGGVSSSLVAHRDERIDAVVGWDNVTLGGEMRQNPGDTTSPVAPRVPLLGISADYYLGEGPKTEDPDPLADLAAFEGAAAAGIDAMQVTIRGGTHLEFAALPWLPATLRGVHLSAWYTVAWFDKHLKAESAADLRLLSDRWRHDAPGAQADLGGDANLLSYYYRSRVSIRLASGPRVRCDDLRSGCTALVPAADDGYPGAYDYVEDSGG
ncbi:MAG TPA: hypothetical protein VNT54_00720 [Solirubrobacteraceae bacterium]|nr:hypothetical protein [Solirubrobacteraceae bacterium]